MIQYKNILITFLTILLIAGSVAMIGWIGFQEHIRLAVQNLKHATLAPSVDMLSATGNARQRVIEDKKEAEAALKQLEGNLKMLEEDTLPRE